MTDQVERMGYSLDAIKRALLKRKLNQEDLAEAAVVIEALRAIVARSGERTHGIKEIKGLGKEMWEGVDVHDYIRKERESWR
jgi:hypothetical protein